MVCTRCGEGSNPIQQAPIVHRTYQPQYRYTGPRREPAQNHQYVGGDSRVMVGCDKCEDLARVCIPHHVVNTKVEARQFPLSLVDVIKDDALYWIDGEGMTHLVSKRIKYENNHEAVEGKFADRQVIDQANSKMYYYMPDGQVFYINLTQVERSE